MEKKSINSKTESGTTESLVSFYKNSLIFSIAGDYERYLMKVEV